MFLFEYIEVNEKGRGDLPSLTEASDGVPFPPLHLARWCCLPA